MIRSLQMQGVMTIAHLWVLHEYLVNMHSLSYAQNDNCLTLSNPFILGGPPSTLGVSIFHMTLGKEF